MNGRSMKMIMLLILQHRVRQLHLRSIDATLHVRHGNAWPGRWPHDEAAGALKTRDKRCSRSSFGTRMAETWWRKLCPIHQSISAIRTRKSSKARGGYSTEKDFRRSRLTKSWTMPV